MGEAIAVPSAGGDHVYVRSIDTQDPAGHLGLGDRKVNLTTGTAVLLQRHLALLLLAQASAGGALSASVLD